MKYEKWSLGYWVLKQYVRFIDWIIHKKVILLGQDNIPKNKPILFAPNHQNALSDPMAILLHTNYQPVWLARADIFKKGIITYLLRFLKIMPVYRMRDGKEQLAKNDKTFADSIKVLENNCALALFPEAAHSGKRQMLSHKKAVPRIVFMAEEKAEKNLDIHIVPVGIYYSSYWKFNRTVIVNFGNPIKVNQYLNDYEKNPNAAILALRNVIYNAIEPLTINIKSKKHYNSFECIREVYGKHYAGKNSILYSDENRFKSDQQLCNVLDTLEDNNPKEIDDTCSEANAYSKLLKKHKLKSWLLDKGNMGVGSIVASKLILLLGFPIFLFGFIFNALPFFIIDIFTRKKIKDRAFWSTFSLAGGMFVFPIFYLFELWASAAYIPGIGFKLLFVISLPISGKLAFLWYILFRKTLGRIRLFFIKYLKPNTYNNLIAKRDQLFRNLDDTIKTA